MNLSRQTQTVDSSHSNGLTPEFSGNSRDTELLDEHGIQAKRSQIKMPYQHKVDC
jgi:hypothetical protein